MALSRLPIALQLFTVRDRAADDLPGVLEETARMGYDGVEFAGLFNHQPAALRRQLDDLGLRVCSAHMSLDRLIHQFDRCIEEARDLQFNLVVVPYLSEEFRGPNGYPEAVKQMVEIADRLREHDLRLAYHHHSFEFETISAESAQRGIDFILDAPADKLLLEIDVYWARHGGVEPAVFLRRHVERTPLLHLKDMRDPTSRRFAEIGAGMLDFHRILLVAMNYGVEWLIVEQDSDFAVSSMDSARAGIETTRQAIERILSDTPVV